MGTALPLIILQQFLAILAALRETKNLFSRPFAALTQDAENTKKVYST